MINAFFYGKLAELIAVLYLLFKGYSIIATRYKNHRGEIDIICKKKNFIIFVEVKARRKIKHLELISFRQKQRISQSATCFLQREAKFCNFFQRFDIIFIEGLLNIKHIKNYW